MKREEERPGRLEATARALIAATAVALVALLAYTTLSRVGFPYELEWDEGWTVDAIRRILDGQSLWTSPSLEWLPYTYPPLFPYLSAALSALIGVGFLAPRLVSLTSAVGCLVVTFELVRRETGRAWCGLAAAGFLAGTYPRSGSWFDIGRVDTLFLLLVLAAVLILRGPPSARRSVAAGTVMALACLTKQTSVLPLACLSLYGLFEWRGWKRVALPVTSGFILAGTTLVLSALTDGWYYYATVTMPRLHGLGQVQMLGEYWTSDLGLTFVPAGLLALLALGRRFRDRSSDFVFWTTLTVGMLGASWISRLHGGGWLNVLQPAHAMLAILFGLGLGEMKKPGVVRAPLLVLAQAQLVLLFYSPAAHIPTARDVRDGDDFVAFLRDVEGEVYTPMHGFLPALAGKKVFAQDDYLVGILGTGDAAIVEPLLDEFHRAFETRRFAAVVIDYEDYRFMDLLREFYRPAGEVPGSFRPRKGPVRARQRVWVPRTDPKMGP